MLIVVERLFSTDEAESIRQRLLQCEWINGRLTAGGVAAQVKSNLQLDDQNVSTQELSSLISERLYSSPDFVSAALPDRIFPPKFNCYQNGGAYGLHVDGSIMTHPLDGRPLRTDVSGTVFFSDPASYDGGELCIETAFGVQEVKLNAGDLVLYPSSSLHQVQPVKEGARICAFFWIQSMVRGAEQRALLYDLDQSIQQLTRRLGAGDEEVLRLNGIYHNLLRSEAM